MVMRSADRLSSSSSSNSSSSNSELANSSSSSEPAAPSRPVLWRRGCLVQAQTQQQHSSSPAAGDWATVYWQHQAGCCRAYDAASCVLKVLLLVGNVKRSLGHGELHAARCAAGAAMLCMLSLVLMLACQAQSLRHRRLVMWSNIVAISIMMATSMPQFLSATPSRLWGHRALVLLFKMGVTWPMMAALMHRLPWQDLAVLCSGFCLWLCATWARPLCHHLHSSPADAALIQSLAGMLDRVTGLGMDSAVLGSLPSSDADPHWAPLAHHIADVCASTLRSDSSSGGLSPTGPAVLTASDCEALQMGQCQAVVTTLTLWVGVCVILFCVVLAEQHSKWRWWHSSGAHWQGRPPHIYATSSGWSFLGLRLLYLHILLDVPLMLLYVATSSVYRQPTGPLGEYNLW